MSASSSEGRVFLFEFLLCFLKKYLLVLLIDRLTFLAVCPGRKHIYIQIFYMAVIVQQRAQRCRQMSSIAVIGSIDNVDPLKYSPY